MMNFRIFILSLVLVGLIPVPAYRARAQSRPPPGGSGVDERWAETQLKELSTGLRFDGTKALSTDDHFRKGLLYHARGEYLKALDQFERVAELNPGDAGARLNHGIALGDLGRLNDALGEFDSALEIDPSNAAAQFNRGIVYMRQGKYGEAISSMESAIAAGADSPLLHYNLAVCHEYADGTRYGAGFDKEKSVFHYRKALDKKPDSAVLHYNLGMVYLRANDGDAAEAELREAVGLDPSLADAFLHMGLLMLERENYHSALNNLKEAGKIDPGLSVDAYLAEAYSGLGQFYLDNGDFDRARKNYEEVLRFDSARANDLVRLARAYRGLERYSDAIGCFDEALSIDESLPLSREIADVYFAWGETLLSQAQPRLAASKYEIGLGRNSGDGRAWARLGEIYHRHVGDEGRAVHSYRKSLPEGLTIEESDRVKRKMAEVVRDGDSLVDRYRRLVSRNPDNATLHYNLAVFYHERGDLDAAVKEYRRALQIEPGNSFAHYNLGLAYQRKGVRSAALREFKLALHLNPNYWRARYALGKLYEDAGENAKARHAYEKTVEAKPDFAAGRLALGLLLEKAGENAAAREQLKKYIDLSRDAALAPAKRRETGAGIYGKARE